MEIPPEIRSSWELHEVSNLRKALQDIEKWVKDVCVAFGSAQASIIFQSSNSFVALAAQQPQVTAEKPRDIRTCTELVDRGKHLPVDVAAFLKRIQEDIESISDRNIS